MMHYENVNRPTLGCSNLDYGGPSFHLCKEMLVMGGQQSQTIFQVHNPAGYSKH